MEGYSETYQYSDILIHCAWVSDRERLAKKTEIGKEFVDSAD